jgi:hypothetical protein
MVKCFLSHSSSDKKSYVEIVAKKLGYHKCVYDEFTFEEGMKSLEEILKGLNKSDLFVIFISEFSLTSDWVKEEIIEAKNSLEKGEIKKIFPIIIDKNITYLDQRIPDWMRQEYNIKFISRPTVAARRIEQRLKEISWENHPRLKNRKKIFVGRNNLISFFEERIDNFDKPTPTCIIASGIQEIGRRTLLRNCCVKSNLIDESYEFPVINLNSQESLEDFIYKIYDLGLSEEYDLTDFMKKSRTEKISIAINIINDVQKAREIISIVDDGCIVTFERDIAQWFLSLLNNVKSKEKLTFSIASSYRLLKRNLIGVDSIYSIDVPELDRTERDGLLKRYSKFEDLDLRLEDLSFFSNLLSGYPGQIFYAVDLIKDEGVEKARKNADLIREFNSTKAQRLLQKYESNQEKIDFLYFLSEFDFISYEFIFKIVDEERFHKIIDELIASAVCELLGANGEYVRVNNTVRDYVRRNRFSLPEHYQSKLKEHLEDFLKTYQEEEKDVSDYFYSLKQALIQGKQVQDKYLIPSHFLKTIKELYDRYHKYDDVINLADRVLVNEESLDSILRGEIRYFLCLSLARKRNKERFLNEVQKIQGSEHNFLMGFYYRLQSRPQDAIPRLQKALEEPRTSSRARRELVQIYIDIEDYQEAVTLAKENYENNTTNPFHVQAYFNCLINSPKINSNEKILEQLLTDLEKVSSEKAKEMFMNAKAQFLAFCKFEQQNALNLINDTIALFPDVIYPKLTKFDICSKFKDIDGMKESISMLKQEIDSKSYFYKSLIRSECIFMAQDGKLPEALRLVDTKLKNYSDQYRKKLKQKLEQLAS